jgi:hypothetical protein
VPPAQLAHPTAVLGRAGEADLADEVLVEGAGEPVVRGRAVGHDHLEHVTRHAAGPEQPGERVGDRRRRLGGLPHDGVAAEQGRHEVPRRHGGGKFAAVTMNDTPTGIRNVKQRLVGHLARHRLPYSRRPSPRKKSQVSTTSCTSPSASA